LPAYLVFCGEHETKIAGEIRMTRLDSDKDVVDDISIPTIAKPQVLNQFGGGIGQLSNGRKIVR